MSTGQTPKYLDSIEDVPASGPDPYSKEAKGRAIRDAEAMLEANVNDGNEFDPADIEPIHQAAIIYFATYRLAIDPKSPDAATMGSMSDEGSRRMDYADRLLELYERTVSAITGSSGDAGEGGGGLGGDDGEYSPPTLTGGGHVFID